MFYFNVVLCCNIRIITLILRMLGKNVYVCSLVGTDGRFLFVEDTEVLLEVKNLVQSLLRG